MALFKTKEKKKVEVQVEKPSSVVVAKKIGNSSVITLEPSDIIIKPRITEKATDKQQDNVYCFEISLKANKKSVKTAFAQIYKIQPVKINIVKNPAKNVVIRGKKGVKKGVKKAYVFLKEGDKIEVI